MKQTTPLYTYVLAHGFKHTKLQHTWSNGAHFDLDDETLVHMPSKRKSRAAAATPINERTVVKLGELTSLVWALEDKERLAKFFDGYATILNEPRIAVYNSDGSRFEAADALQMLATIRALVDHIRST